jgi:two-component system phosphate regulon sensor histidine kinase PhoR
MGRSSPAGWTKRRLRVWLTLFFLALALPTAVLVHHAYRQLKWEAFHQYQLLAEELGARIDGRFIQLVNREEARTFADYGFLVVAGDPSARFLQRSPLSAYPVASNVPGLIGYFQVDADGVLSTPLLPQPGADPAEYGIPPGELQQRSLLADRLRGILGENRLVQDGGRKRQVFAGGQRWDKDREGREGDDVAGLTEGVRPVSADAAQEDEQAAPQAAFDRLSEATAELERQKKQGAAAGVGRVEDLVFDVEDPQQDALRLAEDTAQRQIRAENIARLEKRGARKERAALPEPHAAGAPEAALANEVNPATPRVHIFESEIDPFDFALLDSGHFVLFRKVWRDGRRYIQGALIEQQPLLRGVVGSALRETVLAQMSDLGVAWRGRVLAVFSGQASRGYPSSADELSGTALYQTRLSAPLGDMELLFSVNRLPSPPGGTVIHWLGAILVVVLCGGFYLLYRLGVRQIELGRQQQDFVSAVSHELKTPLTSIRMYGEMLREGWAPEDKKRAYYDYIYDESERLSRLITNVLQLARMTRNDLRLDLRPVRVGGLMDGIRSKIASQVERAGFSLTVDCEKAVSVTLVSVDADAFSQVLINLVDNAIKFSAQAERRAVEIRCRRERDDVVFSVRDYGPGVPRDQMKKIFRLFYRSENELTRETLGTGIGLALVHQLAQAMDGKVDVVNRNPGAEFRLSFPVAG